MRLGEFELDAELEREERTHLLAGGGAAMAKLEGHGWLSGGRALVDEKTSVSM